MKKYILTIVSMLCILSLVGCGKKEKFEIEISVPAGSTEAFVYSDEEICPTGNKVKIWSGAGLGDTEVILKPVNENVETGYVAEYLTHGMPVEFDTSNVKNEWFKIGVAVQNDSDKGPIAVSVEVEGVEVRISNKANQDFFNAVVLEVNGNEILTECTECESGWIFEGCEVAFDTNTLSTEEVPNLEVGDLIRVVYVGGTNDKESVHLEQVVSSFWIDDNGKIVTAPAKKSVQKIETPDFGITLTVKNVTSKGLTLVCEQSGGESIGELFSGSSYSLSRYVEGNWETLEYLPKDTEIAWTDEAWIIPLEDTVEWEVNWEWMYGELVPGKYRMSKPVMNLAGPGDFNTAMHFVEFDVAE